MVAMMMFLILFPYVSFAETEDERRVRLEAQLDKVEQQIIKQQALVKDKREERQTLERDLDLIDSEIKQAELGIEARTIAISQLTEQIGDKEAVVDILNGRLGTQRASLAELIRETSQADDYSMVEILLGNQNFSEFFTDADRFLAIKDSLNESLSALVQIKDDTEEQKLSLIEKQSSEAELRRIQLIEKRSIEEQESLKEEILQETKGEEAVYQQLLEAQQKTAAQLRAQLFALLGGGGPIPFPEAVAYAQVAESLTGVPASLVLAILEQESSYGSNIGSCTMGDVSSGKDIMHPDRDKPVFLAIAKTLGFDAATQQVSCPLRRADGSRIGWGGAMGPSQFIPSTWAIFGGYVQTAAGHNYVAAKDTIRSLLKKTSPSSPYTNQDAFVATALLLRDNGANGSYSADRLAALRYYAGWGGASNPENAFYGDGVMKRKARLQNEIKILGGE